MARISALARGHEVLRRPLAAAPTLLRAQVFLGLLLGTLPYIPPGPDAPPDDGPADPDDESPSGPSRNSAEPGSTGPGSTGPGSACERGAQRSGHHPGGSPPGAAGSGDPRGGGTQWGGQPGDPRSDDPRSDDPRSDDPRSDDPRSGDPRSGDPRSDDPRSDDPRSDDPRSGGSPRDEDSPLGSVAPGTPAGGQDSAKKAEGVGSEEADWNFDDQGLVGPGPECGDEDHDCGDEDDLDSSWRPAADLNACGDEDDSWPDPRLGMPAWPEVKPFLLPAPQAMGNLRPGSGGLLDLTLPWSALAGDPVEPGYLSRLGPITPEQARHLADLAADDPAVQWRIILTSPAGHALATTHIPRANVRAGPQGTADGPVICAGLVGRVTVTIPNDILSHPPPTAAAPILSRALRAAARAAASAAEQAASDAMADGGCAHTEASVAYTGRRLG